MREAMPAATTRTPTTSQSQRQREGRWRALPAASWTGTSGAGGSDGGWGRLSGTGAATVGGDIASAVPTAPSIGVAGSPSAGAFGVAGCASSVIVVT